MSVTSQQSLHFPEDHTEAPLVAAEKFISSRFSTTHAVLEAARHLLAQQIAVHPQLRGFIRRVYFSDAVVSVQPTEKGMKEIHEQHHAYSVYSS